MRRDVFQAIADPIRREIIGLVSQQTLNTNQVADHFDISRPAVSKHLKILRACGLLNVQKKGRQRICQAKLDQLGEVALWVQQYQAFWNENLNRLGEVLRNGSPENR